MLLNERGIVLHHIKYGETSIICKILTEHHGLQSFIVNGVRASKSKWKTNLFQHLQPLEMVIYFKEGRNIHRIGEASPMMIFTEIPFNIHKSTYALFISEVLYRSIPAEMHAENLFELVLETVKKLERPEKTGNLLFEFLIELSACFGFNPRIHDYDQTDFFDLREGLFTSYEPVHSDFLNKTECSLFSELLSGNFNGHSISSEGNLAGEIKYALLLKILTYYRIHLKDFHQIRSAKLLNPAFF